MTSKHPRTLFWSVAVALFAVAASSRVLPQTPSAQGPTFTVLYSFTGGSGNGDGVFPYGGLVMDSQGNLYGTTYQGGTNAGFAPVGGCGIVFKLTRGGQETVLYRLTQNAFSTTNGGCNPAAGLAIDSAGNLYGTAFRSLNSGCCAGSVFEIDRFGKETQLWQFAPAAYADLGAPNSALVVDGVGNLFGTGTLGGNLGFGGVFKLDSAGNYSWVYLFNGGADGSTPYRSRLLLDQAGNLYGTAQLGGDLSCGSTGTYAGCGVVFALTASGQETVLHAFHGGSDGINPVGDMARDSQGNLYGVTQAGGTNGNGVVFRVTPSGQETVLYTFRAGFDGQPMGGVILDAGGSLYGTTTLGGAHHRGSVFKLDPAGRRTEVHNFAGGKDGGRPFGTLIQDAQGRLYGTTVDGGANQQGNVFEISP